MSKLFRILSIDGGGIRGVFAAQILKRVHDELGIQFSEYFDIISGTSTGSIIAAGLAIDYPIGDIVDMYRERGKKIFCKNYLKWLDFKNWKNYFKSKYNNRYLFQELKNVFEDKTLSDTKTRLIIPASDISNGNVFVLKSNYDQNFVRDKNTKLSDAVLASCSAPLFFKPHMINDYLLADGGLWANNPALVALTEAMGRRFKIQKEKIRIFSIGTGIGKKYYDPKDFNKNWGFRQWGVDLISTIMNLNSINIDNIIQFLIEDNFFRINFHTDCNMELDDLNTVENLIARANEQFEYSFENINRFLREE